MVTLHTFADFGAALACAARVVKPDGRIILLTEAAPDLDTAAELLCQAEDPGQAHGLLRKHAPFGMAAAFQWANAAQGARIYLLSHLPAETAEELFTIPLEHAGQVHRLTASAESCVILPDAHKSLAVATNA